MKMYRLILVTTLAWAVLSTGISAQSIKKSKNQTIEQKNYTSHQLNISGTPKDITMTFIKNVGEIETEYWISLMQTTNKHESIVTINQDNFLKLAINSGTVTQSFDLSKFTLYKHLGKEVFFKSDYIEKKYFSNQTTLKR